MTKGNLKIYLPKERGFCFGVNRALKMLEEAVGQSLPGESVYVYHPIIHNKEVIRSFEKKGVVFVDKAEQVPEGSVLLFSAHGVGKEVEKTAALRRLKVIDATCPFVKKVHLCAERLEKEGRAVFIIGKKGHDEVVGTKGRLSSSCPVFIVEKKEEVAFLPLVDKAGYVTQTTLTPAQTKEIVAALKEKYPFLEQTESDNICQATLQRQQNAATVAPFCNAFFVIGDESSSNSVKLKDTALKAGAKQAFLVENLKGFKKVFLQNAPENTSENAHMSENAPGSFPLVKEEARTALFSFPAEQKVKDSVTSLGSPRCESEFSSVPFGSFKPAPVSSLTSSVLAESDEKESFVSLASSAIYEIKSEKAFLPMSPGQEGKAASKWAGKSIGLMTSASAPEEILREILSFLSDEFAVQIREVS